MQLLAAATPPRRRAEGCAHAIRAGSARAWLGSGSGLRVGFGARVRVPGRAEPLDGASAQLGGAAHESNLAQELEQLPLVGVECIVSTEEAARAWLAAGKVLGC
eukprot:scaffold19396_cov46-Phaeocystis_antarctica.AAC.3